MASSTDPRPPANRKPDPTDSDPQDKTDRQNQPQPRPVPVLRPIFTDWAAF